jgi:hypothetical protein
MAIEECAELQQAIIHFRRGRVGVLAVAEEIVDVQLMLDQLKLMYDLPDTLLLDERQHKLERLAKLLRRELPGKP